ncbi:uncharacterized protein RSE6_05560 [Rhynchosporium secalis]|uniref:Uncharacterized protein n=1 Tax=Rhynchosporium secalis TaxID=38038 RepID=A0A1E1M849_RHYSE|nr:uncharacterized protein RSE6_05560 [Rhynchosporium secalis]
MMHASIRSQPLRSTVPNTSSTAQPKHSARFSFTASIINNTLPISNMVAPTKALIPPAFTILPENSEDGILEGKPDEEDVHAPVYTPNGKDQGKTLWRIGVEGVRGDKGQILRVLVQN